MKNKCIIVDDDVIFHMIAERYIKNSGLDEEPQTFEDGVELKRFFEAKPDPDTHYIIFLDINMPIMSGWDFLEWVKDHTIAKAMSVFIVTSSKNPDDEQHASQYDLVKGFLIKPFNKEYISLVEERLK